MAFEELTRLSKLETRAQGGCDLGETSGGRMSALAENYCDLSRRTLNLVGVRRVGVLPPGEGVIDALVGSC